MAPGAKKMLTWEFNHAYEAAESGIYVTWKSHAMLEDQCFRVGSESRCFCGHLFKVHEKAFMKGGKLKNSCQTCECKAFNFIPRRPEEIGQHWLPRRKGFNINTWGASCKCTHTHMEHSAIRPHGCKTCGCSGFQSDFTCISCNQKFEEHETIYEKENERKAERKSVREDYMPLASNPDAQAAAMNNLGIDSRTPEQRFIDEMRIEEEKKANGGMLNLELSAGGGGRPQVNLVVNTMKNQAPKQNINKPERSIQLMQARGMAGQHPPNSKMLKGGTGVNDPVKPIAAQNAFDFQNNGQISAQAAQSLVLRNVGQQVVKNKK